MTSKIRTETFVFNWTPKESEEIRRRARERMMHVGPYLIAAALGEIDQSNAEDRLDVVEERLKRLEQMAGLGGFE